MEAVPSAGTSAVRKRVQIESILDSRYGAAPAAAFSEDAWFVGPMTRPIDWDQRKAGIDTVRTVDGDTLLLRSDGGQSVPKPGWVLLLTGGNAKEGFTWTLYGIPPHS